MEIYKRLVDRLKTEPNYSDDEGKLKKWVVLQKAQDADAELIALLLGDEELRKAFFRDVAGVLVFDQKKLSLFLEQKCFLADSYTQYRKKIGMAVDGKFLSQHTGVELVWPYKDCVLEGGQTREEQSRSEIFFNQTLAQDEITQLKEPKVLTGGRKYTADGSTAEFALRRNDNGVIADNLIIKGNNLLALYTLERQFGGKVKLVYIDVPFNTGNDTFGYNDNFSHSTWLTFMQNRLQIVKRLLRSDGVVFIECDKNEAAYLKVLCDEVFGRENFVSDIAVQTSYANGLKVSQKEKTILKMKDTILVYKKDEASFVPQYIEKKYWDVHYNLFAEKQGNGSFNLLPLKEKLIANNIIGANDIISTSSINDAKFYDFVYKNKDVICCLNPIHNKNKRDSVKEQSKNKVFAITSANGNTEYFYNGRQLGFLSQSFHDVGGRERISILLGDIWTDIDFGNNQNEGGVDFPAGKKPEQLLKRIISMTTSEGDIVLDFFSGSGTTGAVAHKMRRQYILCEQLDSQIALQLTRMPLVIGTKDVNDAFGKCKSYDLSGVSKDVNWQGGGEFVYLELKKYNQAFMDEIEAATTSGQLLDILERIKAKSFIDYNVDLKQLETALDEFKALTIEQQKQALCTLLDKNQLYVNLSSLNDEEFECTDDEKRLTRDFYGIKE